MKLVFNVYFLTTVFLFVGFNAQARSKESFTKTIQKEFAIPADGTTYLSNKYGQIEVKTWDKNRVKITVEIVVNAKSSSAANSVFDRINIQFSNGSDYVKAATMIESTNSWMSWYSSNKSDFKINYEVFLPETNKLDLIHRYGDVYVAAMTGKVKLDVKYVNFMCEGLGEHASLLFGYGDGTIVKAKNLDADISYSKLLVQEAHDVNLSTKYTEVRVDRAHDVNATSRYDTYVLGYVQDLKNFGSYDNFRITSASSIAMTTNYTQIKADKITQSAQLTVKYSNTDIKMGASFRSVLCDGGYSDFKIGVPASASYTIDGNASYAGLQYPEQIDMDYDVKKNNVHTIKGKFGQSGNAKISLNLKYGGGKVYTF
jgi:hypothetical protein